MAGMLPGVECARRRRLHQSSDSQNSPTQTSARKSSFCLYTTRSSSNTNTKTSHESIIPKATQNSHRDEKLEPAAREAKARLDHKLRRKNSETSKREMFQCMGIDGRLRKRKKKNCSNSKMFGWVKLGWNGSEQDEECTICLDPFKIGDTLVQLPCAHNFHSNCLVPWLETNAHCPFCRMEIFSSSS